MVSEVHIVYMEFDTFFVVFLLVFFTIPKATFEAFIGIRDDTATSQVKLFGDQLQVISLSFL
jgi:hypothetical protein